MNIKVLWKSGGRHTYYRLSSLGNRYATRKWLGEDPNWGRIISAAGSTGVPFSTTALDLSIEHVPLFKNGTGVAGREAAEVMKKDTIRVLVRLGMGDATFRVYASDLSHEYVDINALYRT